MSLCLIQFNVHIISTSRQTQNPHQKTTLKLDEHLFIEMAY